MTKKNYLIGLLLLSLSAFSQEKIFEIARNGTAVQMDSIYMKDSKLMDFKSSQGFTPIILAAYQNNIEVVAYLLQKKVNINDVSPMGSPLMAAVVKNNKTIVEMLLQANANPNLTDANGSSALHYAVLFKLYEIIPILIQNGADVELLDNVQKSPRTYAELSKDEKLIKLLN
jgi:uncharacterized protein